MRFDPFSPCRVAVAGQMPGRSIMIAALALSCWPAPSLAAALGDSLRRAGSFAFDGAAEPTFVSRPGDASEAPPVGPVRELPPIPPASLGEPLAPRFLDVAQASRPEARAEWRRRLGGLQGGKASLVPVGAFDPERELLVHVPGLGMTFRDAHALARLADTYQVLIGISDQRRPHRDNARYLAKALEEVLRYRAVLRSRRGLNPRSDLRLFGHSFGAFIAYRTLDELAKRGSLGEGSTTLIGRALYVGIDGPWRGADVPWIFLAPGVKLAAATVLPRLPLPKRITPGALSNINRTKLMTEVRNVTLPPSVTIQYVTVNGSMSMPPAWRHLEPVANWHSAELGKGELERLWRFLRRDDQNPRHLSGWAHLGLFRTQGLQNLYQFLKLDADFPAHADELVQAAHEARTPEDFAVRYDEVISRIVDTFSGQHTEFMWTDPAFMPWIRGLLRDWDAGAPPAR